MAGEIKELAENFDQIAHRRDTVRRKVKEANIAIEKERNKQGVNKTKEDKEEGPGSGKRGGGKSDAEKQFKQPTRALPQ